MISELSIRDTEHVRKINSIACSKSFDVWMHGKNMMLDAKSLLGLYAFVGQRVHVVVEDDVNRRVFDRMAAAMA